MLVGKKAPQFTSTAVINKKIVDNFSLSDLEGQYTILFFYPLNFTFVCPTELHAFQERLSDFEKRNAQIVGCSVDSPYSHFAWIHTPKIKGGIEGITYPLVSDLNKTIAKTYEVLSEENGIAFRGLFLIDKEGIIRHQLINDLPIGRSIDEVLRTLDAWIYFEEHGQVCPANWKTGEKTLTPDQAGLEKYFLPV